MIVVTVCGAGGKVRGSERVMVAKTRVKAANARAKTKRSKSRASCALKSRAAVAQCGSAHARVVDGRRIAIRGIVELGGNRANFVNGGLTGETIALKGLELLDERADSSQILVAVIILRWRNVITL